MKIKIITSTDPEAFEKEVNKFLSRSDIAINKVSTDRSAFSHGDVYIQWDAIILYDEKDQKEETCIEREEQLNRIVRKFIKIAS